MRELPGGTVTLVFADIEGSTRLLRALGDRYGSVLLDFRRLLREAFDASGGTEVDSQGDACFAAFPRALDAAKAAAATQRALASHAWPDDVELRVRMGIHTGEPSVGDDGYLGIAVHRAARICATGNGGQVLVSRTTRDLLEDTRTAEWELRDLGEHALKDFDEPEHLYEIVVAGLPDRFMPLRTPAEQPEEATTFAGREHELAAVAQAKTAGIRPEGLEQPFVGRFAGIPRLSLVRGAVQSSLRSPPGFVSVLAVPLAVVVGMPWLAPLGAVGFGAVVVAKARRARFSHGLQGIGWRVHSLARIAPDDALRAGVLDLASAVATAARVAAHADRLLEESDRRTLVRKLREERDMSTASVTSLFMADSLARQIAALDVVTEQRKGLDAQCSLLDVEVGALRERLFEIRLDTTNASHLVNEIASMREQIAARATQLDEANEWFAKEKRLVGRPR